MLQELEKLNAVYQKLLEPVTNAEEELRGGKDAVVEITTRAENLKNVSGTRVKNALSAVKHTDVKDVK